MTNYNKDKTSTSLTVNSERFNNKIQEIKQFSKNIPKESDLPIFHEKEGFFKWVKQDVSVSDINELTDRIQDKMIKQNKTLVKTIQEFEKVYDTFSILNKEYILKIVASIKASEEANSKAIKGLDEIGKSNEEINKSNQVLKNHQKKLDSLINHQVLIVNGLKKFKNELEELEHLKKVDAMYESISLLLIDIENIDMTIDDYKKKIDKLFENENSIKINFNRNKEELKKITNSIQLKVTSIQDKIKRQEELLIQLQIANKKNEHQILSLENEVLAVEESLSNYKESNDRNIKNINKELIDIVQNISKRLNNVEENYQINKKRNEHQILNLENEVLVVEESFNNYKKTNDRKIKNVNEELIDIMQNVSKSLNDVEENYQKELTMQKEIINKITKKLKMITIAVVSSFIFFVILITFIISGAI
ncbi:coiled-coil domain-containing protein [Staphylococcus equorum]|uniref:coiled-coil domain-containing protein n=1 Tax=Staphylococcus equorum TaxID=246432 RepID=UPI003EBC329D